MRSNVPVIPYIPAKIYGITQLLTQTGYLFSLFISPVCNRERIAFTVPFLLSCNGMSQLHSSPPWMIQMIRAESRTKMLHTSRSITHFFLLFAARNHADMA